MLLDLRRDTPERQCYYMANAKGLANLVGLHVRLSRRWGKGLGAQSQAGASHGDPEVEGGNHRHNILTASLSLSVRRLDFLSGPDLP